MVRGKETAERDASSSGSHNWLIWGGAIATIIWFVGMILYAACVYPSYAVTDLTGAQRAADAGGQVHLWWRHHIGEHGDYLTGFLTPVAFGWFVITVFLQREELINQRTELRLSREQYEKTAEANEQISKSTDRQLVLRMLVDIERIGLSYVVQISEKFGSSMSIAGYPGRNINTRILPTEAASDNLAGAIRDLRARLEIKLSGISRLS